MIDHSKIVKAVKPIKSSRANYSCKQNNRASIVEVKPGKSEILNKLV